MKKNFFVFALLGFAAMLFSQEQNSQKKWNNNFMGGLAVPVTLIEADSRDVSILSFAQEIGYVGMHSNGFTVKAVERSGFSFTDDIEFDGSDDSIGGAFVGLDLGAGYSFVRTSGFNLSVLAMIGFELETFETELEEDYVHAELGEVDRSQTCTFLSLTLGADILAMFRIKNHFSIYANLAARYIPVGGLANTVIYSKDKFSRTDSVGDDFKNSFSFTPTVGVVFTL
ncbi:MAG: hypothetical protein IJJ70_05555 [Treponema sp.]|nr:hypothetical protein [bacterium]MBR0487153.1 hypothetical protein [Treponema sp.]